MYIYIYILIYILIKEAIAFFAFFAFLLFTRIWFTEIYIVWSHTGNFFLFEVIRIVTCAGASRTDVFFLLGIKK